MRIPRRYAILLTLGAFLLLVPGSGLAQKKPDVSVRKWEYNDRRTPDFKDKSYDGANSVDRWFQVYIEYEARGGREGENGNDWIDDLMLDWSVLIRNRSGRFILLKKQVTYKDVEAKSGRKHNAVVYVRPNFLRRWYGSAKLAPGDVWVHLEIYADGSRVASEDFGRSRSPGDGGWWSARGDSRIRFFEDELLSRDETPFAPLDYDFYEHIKPAKK